MPLRTHLLAASFLSLLGLSHAAQALPAIGLTTGNALFSFDTATPGASGAAQAITGLQAGETLYALDYRPSMGVLYGLGSSNRLYTINTSTAAATVASTLSVPLSGSGFDIGFNPTVDRLRIVSTGGQNLRVNVDTGAVTTDTPVAFAASDANAGAAPSVVGVAYTNQLQNLVLSTTLYDLDSTRNVLVTQAPPNSGILNTVGPLGVTGLTGFEIDGPSGAAFAATSNELYRVSLQTGAATLIGAFGTGGVSDFALVQVPEPVSIVLLGVGVAGLAMTRRRGAAVAA